MTYAQDLERRFENHKEKALRSYEQECIRLRTELSRSERRADNIVRIAVASWIITMVVILGTLLWEGMR